jgi:hypothetical protein
MRLVDEIRLATSLQLLGPDGLPIYAAKKRKKKKQKPEGDVIDPSHYNEDEVDDLSGLLADSFDDHKFRPHKKQHQPSYIDSLSDGLSMSWYKGYDAGLGGDDTVPVQKHKRAWKRAQARALELSRTTHKTSKKLIKSGSDYVNNPLRAKRIAKYESALAFFLGFKSANQGSGKLKSWVAQSDNPCPVCEEAEGEDPIDMDDAFAANDLTNPPGHLNCQCILLLHHGDAS